MLLLTITIIALMVTVNTFAKTVVTDDLVGYWTFDQGTILGNKVKDVWNDNDATIVGDPRKVDGYVRGGLQLDGNGDYVSLPNVGNFGSRIGEYTFEAWIKTTQTKKWSAIYRVLEGRCANSNNGTGILINAVSDRGIVDIGGGNDNILTEPNRIMFERSRIGKNGCGSSRSGKTFPISDGKWHQIVFTTRPATEKDAEEFRGFGHRQIPIETCKRTAAYIDGNVVMSPLSCSSPPEFIAYVEPIFLGAMNNKGKVSAFFEGVFDEVRIYDRALTADEVLRNYESGIGLSVEVVQKLPTVWGALKQRH